MSLILDLIFPKVCYSCGRAGDYFCSKCQKNLSALTTVPPQNGFDGGLSLFRYDSSIKTAIIDLKYNFVSDNADLLVDIMDKKIKSDFPNLINYWQQSNFILIPIPLFSSRRNWRGFNQSEILCQKLAKKLKLSFSNQILIRHRHNQSQAKIKNTQARIKNVSNIFSLNQGIEKFKNQNFIIFDDVRTTASTLNSAQKAIKILYPNQCWFLTLSVG
jgi:ComF family protein